MDYEIDGAVVLDTGIEQTDIDSLIQEFSALEFKAGARPFQLTPLVRRLLDGDGAFGEALQRLGLKSARPVRVLAFDKSPQSNWNLGWHQDRVIAVKERVDLEGFDHWTIKGGVTHVEAPSDFLNNLFSLRLHLDDCNRNNGALKILPQSFRKGKLLDAEVRLLAQETEAQICEATVGQILAMKALTVHASEPSINPRHRRVLHVDYCNAVLPKGLDWALES